MPTEELEHELRRAFAQVADGYQDPELARQRLLRRDYRPGSGRRRLAGVTAVAAAGSVVLGLGLSGALGSAPGRAPGAVGSAPGGGSGTIRTAAFTLTRNANGTDTLTINPGVLLDPGTLQDDLTQYGIPAKVTVGSFCSSDPGPGGFSQVVTFAPADAGRSGPVRNPTVTINPAAMPTGTELSFGNFQLADGQETAFALIDTNAYTCTSTAPSAPRNMHAAVVLTRGGPARLSVLCQVWVVAGACPGGPRRPCPAFPGIGGGPPRWRRGGGRCSRHHRSQPSRPSQRSPVSRRGQPARWHMDPVRTRPGTPAPV
jgi:hypothetical protein